jgi:hypothetical protein
MREAACTMVWVDALDYAEATEVLAAGLYRCAELPAGHVCSCVRQVLQKEKWDADQSYHVAGEGRPPRGAAFPLRAARLRRPDRFSASSPSCVPPDPPY